MYPCHWAYYMYCRVFPFSLRQVLGWQMKIPLPEGGSCNGLAWNWLGHRTELAGCLPYYYKVTTTK